MQYLNGRNILIVAMLIGTLYGTVQVYSAVVSLAARMATMGAI